MEKLNVLQVLLLKLSVLLIAQATYPVVGIPSPQDVKPTFATTTFLNSPAWVDAYVRMKAEEAGINKGLVSCIVSHESQDRDVMGDDNQSRGWYQISKVWHPEVSDACAHDLACSTAWSLKRINEGHVVEWSTYKLYCANIPIFLDHEVLLQR